MNLADQAFLFKARREAACGTICMRLHGETMARSGQRHASASEIIDTRTRATIFSNADGTPSPLSSGYRGLRSIAGAMSLFARM